MITVEAWMTIRYLHAQGKSMRSIARELGPSRNTVRVALRSDKPAKYVCPTRPNPQLEPFAELIEQVWAEKQFRRLLIGDDETRTARLTE